MKLMTKSDANPKTIKGRKLNYLTAILHLAPFNLSGYQVCALADGCEVPCLNTAGRGGIIKAGETTNAIQTARIRRTRLFFEDRAQFMALIVADIKSHVRRARKLRMKPCVRLNGTSDLPWEKIRATVDGVEYRNLMEAFPGVVFYDYTKVPGRTVPANYHLTFSRSARNEINVIKAIAAGRNVAVVFAKTLPAEFMGRRVIDGDETDLRFLDDAGVIVGLKAKGKAKRDMSGFVVRDAA